MAIETEQLAQEELAVFVEQMNASKHEVDQLKDALTEASQEVVNLCDVVETVQRELDALCSEGSLVSVNGISDAFGKQRVALMASLRMHLPQYIENVLHRIFRLLSGCQCELRYLGYYLLHLPRSIEEISMLQRHPSSRDNIVSAAGDDGTILLKIVEEAFVPISPALARALADDANQIGIRELGGTSCS